LRKPARAASWFRLAAVVVSARAEPEPSSGVVGRPIAGKLRKARRGDNT
jgi:hypothetical protein